MNVSIIRRKFYYTLGFYFLLSCGSFVSHGQKIAFDHLGLSDGLSQISVTEIVQDSINRLWIGTRNGLNLYDGSRIEVYKPEKNDTASLLGHSVLAMHQHGNNLWVGTREGLTHIDVKKMDFSPLPFYEVRSLLYYKKRLLVGTTQGLFCLNSSNDSITPATDIFAHKTLVECLYQDSSGVLWIGSSEGLFRFEDSSSAATLVLPGMVSTVFFDSGKRLWVGTKGAGVFLLDEDLKIIRRFNESSPQAALKSNIIRDIDEDSRGNIWIGTFMGLSVLSADDQEITNYQHTDDYPGKIPHSSIYCITRDRQGTMWVGSYFGGVSFYNPEFDFYRRYAISAGKSDGISYQVVGKMVEDEKKNLWIATEGGGLDYLDRNTGKFSHFRHSDTSPGGLSQNNVRTLYMPNKQTLFIGIYLGGLNIMDIPSGKIKQFMPQANNPKAISSDIVNVIIPFEDYYLLGTHDNIIKFDPISETFSYFLSDSSQRDYIGSVIYSLFADSFGTLWIGTEKEGLVSYRMDNGALKKHKHNLRQPNSLSNNSVYSIFEDHQFRLWIGTLGGGLNQYMRQQDSFKSYTMESHNLPGDFIYGIEESRYGNLWVATNKGLSRFDIENDRFYNYVPQNGFPLQELNHSGLTLTSDGYIFVGGVDGMISFKEEDVLKKTPGFSMVLSSLTVNNKEIVPGDASKILKSDIAFTNSITLKPEQHVFTIHYSATSYLSGKKPLFQYQLEGFDTGWVDAGSQTFATYTNLNGGKYTFKVRALSGIEGEVVDQASLLITVLPPLYKTWYAILFYFVAFFLLVLWFNGSQLSKERLMNQIETERREKTQIQELNQAKLRFFTNISHEFRTPLTLIVGTLESMIEDTKAKAHHYKQLLSLNNNARRLNNLISELLDFRKLEQGFLKLQVSENHLNPFLQEIFESFVEHAHHHHIKYLLKTDIATLKLWFDARQLEKVFYNLIANAFKAVDDNTGSIVIELVEHPESVDILVTDNGAGMSSDKVARIFDRFYQIERLGSKVAAQGSGIGLALCKGLVEEHKGIIEVDSEEDKGTTFKVSLKKGNQHFSEDMLTNMPTLRDTELNQILLHDDDTSSDEPHVEIADKAFTLLLVEDNEQMREMLQNQFSPYYKVLEAADGEEGLKMATDEQPDLIISDVMMPKLSGTEMCARLKRNFNTSHIPVILLTARTALEFKIEGIETGADDYITKPFNLKLLRARVENLLRNRIAIQKRYKNEDNFDIKELTTSTADQKLVEKAHTILETHLDDAEFDVDSFAREIGLGRTMLYSKIKKITGQTPNDFMMTIRLKKAAHLIRTNHDMNVSEIAYATGFSTPRYFSRCFKDFFGVSPSKYGERAEAKVDIKDNNDEKGEDA